MSAVTDGLSTTKTKRFKVKHPKRKLYRSSEPLLSVFMWGINHTVRELTHVSMPVMLMPDDFRAFSKIKIDNQAFNKENLPSHFKVKEYCPLVFRNLRERFGIEDSFYLKSLTKPSEEIDSPGRSGARFYRSQDRLFLMKTLMSEEIEQMHSFLNQYHQYIVERHGKTLLPQYLGMYRITVDNVETHLVVLRSIFSHHLKVHKKYDLKGSTVDREASQKEREKDQPTFKDNDFINDRIKIHIGEEAKEKLVETLRADVKFLSGMHIMDYSLLLGVHDLDADDDDEDEPQAQDGEDQEEVDVLDEEYESGASGGVALTPPDSPQTDKKSTNLTSDQASLHPASRIDPELDIYAIPSRSSAQRREIYFLGVVDILTHYGVKKQAAKVAKTVKYGSSADGISTVDPEQYASRFLDFVANAIE